MYIFRLNNNCLTYERTWPNENNGIKWTVWNVMKWNISKENVCSVIHETKTDQI